MAIVRCTECNAKVSDTAQACPKCGALNFKTGPKKSSKIVKYGGSFVAVVILISALFGTVTDRSDDAHAKAAASTIRSIRQAARDPSSVLIDRFLISADHSVQCVQYRAKNGFGGNNREAMIITAQGTSTSATSWESYCSAGLIDVTHLVR